MSTSKTGSTAKTGTAVDTEPSGKGRKIASDIKGLKKSKVGNYISIGSQAFGVIGIVKQARKAREESDALKLADAVLSAAAVATGVALIIREMRRAKRGDVLAD